MFALSISFLTIVQAGLIAAPGRIPGGPLDRVRSRWWAFLPPASIVLVIAAIAAMAAADAALVAADLLQHPNSVLVHAAPAAGLPRLQTAIFGSAAMGFGDLFIATTVGALLLAERRSRGEAVVLAAALGLGFDLLFLFVNELPATVPIALALAIVDARRARFDLDRPPGPAAMLPREQTSRILR